jgi:Holliday junction resolvase
MSFDSYYRLDKILKKRGDKSFGKICQYLLEICFRELGYSTRGRAVERPDIVAEKETKGYAIECKYQKGNDIALTQRDLDGVLDFKSSNYTPIIAFIWMDINANWVLVDADKLIPKKYKKMELKIYNIKELSDEVNYIFPKVLDDNFELAINRGEEGVRSKIK